MIEEISLAREISSIYLFRWLTDGIGGSILCHRWLKKMA
jgi:hypothetical protein